MAHSPEEWLIQAEYDLETAEFMLSGGRNIYAVFMVHLSIEKALKGIYQKKFNEVPPRKHSLIYFVNKVEIVPPDNIGKFLVKLDQASVATRYPEDLLRLLGAYTQDATKEIFIHARETLKWVKKIF